MNAYINPTGAIGHASNTNQSGQAENKPTIKPDAIGHASNTNQSGQISNKPTINPDAVGHLAKEEAITDLYMSDGDDYYIDDTAFSDAQIGTGDNETAASVVGSGGINGSSETNSNINTGVFGGSSKAAHPGYSLW